MGISLVVVGEGCRSILVGGRWVVVGVFWMVVGIFWVLVGGDWSWWIVARFIVTLRVFMSECTEKFKGFL